MKRRIPAERVSVAQSLPVLTVAALTFASIFYLPPLFLAGAAAAAAGIVAEVMALLGVTPTSPRVGLGLVSWLPVIVPGATTSGDAIAVLACCYIATVLLAARSERDAAAGGALIPAVVFSWICGYWALAPLLPLMALPNGHSLVSLMILFTMLRNSGAYFLGDLVDGAPISSVNPRKTYVGAALALLFAAVLTVPVGLVMALPLKSMLVWFVLLGILGQLGDLTGSLIKRIAGVSESGRLFPGHGGFLDAFDSFLFVVPGTYFYWARLA